VPCGSRPMCPKKEHDANSGAFLPRMMGPKEYSSLDEREGDARGATASFLPWLMRCRLFPSSPKLFCPRSDIDSDTKFCLFSTRPLSNLLSHQISSSCPTNLLSAAAAHRQQTALWMNKFSVNLASVDSDPKPLNQLKISPFHHEWHHTEALTSIVSSISIRAVSKL
jgi:hypothetical protein